MLYNAKVSLTHRNDDAKIIVISRQNNVGVFESNYLDHFEYIEVKAIRTAGSTAES